MCPLSATAYAPATVANLGIGFDILGLALAAPGDTVTAEVTDQPGITLQKIIGDNGLLPTEPSKNTACVAAYHVLKTIAPEKGLTLTLTKNLPLASGLGSSAASAAAGAVAANAALGSPLAQEDLLPACVEAEAIVSGYHADNVAPALLGGIILVNGITTDAIHRLPIPENLFLTIVTPHHMAVETAKARAVLPATIPLQDMVHQTGQVACFIHALHTGDLALLGQAASYDKVVEPARVHLIPYLRKAKIVAHDAGALATFIGGAGPTLCSFCDSLSTAKITAKNLQALYNSQHIATAIQVTTVSQ
ncbi:homoserine kinase, partial [Chloroflexota bacterium]